MTEHKQYVTLGVAESLFAVPVTRVQEILEPQPFARMPRAPMDFLGIIDVRGQSVPVIDLRLRLGMPAADDTLDTRIIVLDIAIDRVFEVAELDGPLEPPTKIGSRWSTDCIAGVGRRNGAFVTVLDLDQLFSQDDVAAGDIAA